jgi:hypothetical protein
MSQPQSAQPMQGLSARALKLLRPVPNQVVLRQANAGIPNAMRSMKNTEAVNAR